MIQVQDLHKKFRRFEALRPFGIRMASRSIPSMDRSCPSRVL